MKEKMKENKLILYNHLPEEIPDVEFKFFRYEEDEWVLATHSQMCPKGRYRIASRHENRVAYFIDKLQTMKDGFEMEWEDWLKNLQK